MVVAASVTLLAAIRRKATKLALPNDKRVKASRAADYRLNKKPHLDHPTVLAGRWPLATGVIERPHDTLPISMAFRRRSG